jgi:hypothetical protein
MSLRPLFVLGVLWAGCCCQSSFALAASGSAELELVGDTRGAAMAFQEWGRLLNNAGVRNVQIRAAQDPVSPKIDVRGTKDRPHYFVTGVVTPNAITVPGARFSRGELSQLAAWLKDLAENGPPDQREAKFAFGLSAAQLDLLRADLAVPVGFSTQGMPRDQVVEKLAERMKPSPKPDAAAMRALAGDTVAEELTDLSCGTALAYVLRSAGCRLAFRPAGGTLAGVIVKMQPKGDAWPVGIGGDTAKTKAIPALFVPHSISMQNVSAGEALIAIADKLKTPLLIDHWAIDRQHIDLAKTTISIPQGKNTYHTALNRLLFQARLKYEVRFDEANTPFLWVTTIKPAELDE